MILLDWGECCIQYNLCFFEVAYIFFEGLINHLFCTIFLATQHVTLLYYKNKWFKVGGVIQIHRFKESKASKFVGYQHTIHPNLLSTVLVCYRNLACNHRNNIHCMHLSVKNKNYLYIDYSHEEISKHYRLPQNKVHLITCPIHHILLNFNTCHFSFFSAK